MSYQKFYQRFLLACISLVVFCFTLTCLAEAQDNWTALAPYNTLWPLWSPALSPVDATTGLPVPVVTSLAPATVLPVEPGLTWDPNLEYPWLLYNTPVGMAYFDPLYGVNFWPPSSLVDSTGAALPVNLPSGYVALPPTPSVWLQQNIWLANLYFLQAYSPLLATAAPSLLLAASPLPLPPAIAAALSLGITVPGLATNLFPAPDINTFLTPAVLLGL